MKLGEYAAEVRSSSGLQALDGGAPPSPPIPLGLDGGAPPSPPIPLGLDGGEPATSAPAVP